MKKLALMGLLLFSASAVAQPIHFYLGRGRVWVPGKGIRTEGPTLPGFGIPRLGFYFPPKNIVGVWPMPVKEDVQELPPVKRSK